jgi:DNA-directed RNA polymerase specialized sigma24 family protein/CheY-like chemotaxis protein
MSSLASVIAPHVPYLRRYARALTGNQESGDAYVVAALETLVEDPSAFPQKMSHRAALFHVFLKIWNSVRLNTATRPLAGSGDTVAADRKLESITPLPRQAFLLVALEDFAIAEAADALGKSEAEVQALIDKAAKEIGQQVSTDVLIIEDEPLISMDLEDVVTSLNHSVIGVARTHKEAVDLVKKKSPGLILADIQLADGSSGIDAVNELLQSLKVPVIFITAFPERLLTGQRPEPTFLITKPFQPATVKAIMSQALFFDWKAGATT